VRHEQAWKLLPDLLEDRDNPELLDHVGDCPRCQRQLFLLGRVDRVLREAASAGRPSRGSALTLRRVLVAIVTVGALAAALVMLVVSHHGQGDEMMLRTAAGQPVGEAVIAHSDARNDVLALTARHLPVGRGHIYVLWAGSGKARLSMQVGRFMVDAKGACRARFNLPATHAWDRFWITSPTRPSEIVART
jgi:hypothetical protein